MKIIKNITAALSVVLLLSSCSGRKSVPEEEVYKPVKYSIVQYSGGLKERTFNGVAKSSSETQLSFRTNGLIVKLDAKVGQRVKKGTLLAKLDQKDVIIAHDKASSDLRNTEVQFETAKSNLERVKLLYQTNNAALSDYEQAKSNFSSAQTNLKAATRSLELQESQIEYTKIYAPMDGVISQVNGSDNEFAQAGAPIVIMSSEKADAELEVGIPEIYIDGIRNGQEAVIVFLSDKENSYKGIVTEVAYSTAGSTTFPVTIKITDPSDKIRPGMAGKATFIFGKAKDKGQLVIPVKAVADDPSGNFVYVLVPENDYYTARKTNVEVGAIVKDGFIINEGLQEGEIVAIAGLSSLFNGKRVKLLP